MTEEEIQRYKSLKTKCKNFKELVEFFHQLNEDDVKGYERVRLTMEKFPEVSEEDILFLLFYPYGWSE